MFMKNLTYMTLELQHSSSPLRVACDFTQENMYNYIITYCHYWRDL